MACRICFIKLRPQKLPGVFFTCDASGKRLHQLGQLLELKCWRDAAWRRRALTSRFTVPPVGLFTSINLFGSNKPTCSSTVLTPRPRSAVTLPSCLSGGVGDLTGGGSPARPGLRDKVRALDIMGLKRRSNRTSFSTAHCPSGPPEPGAAAEIPATSHAFDSSKLPQTRKLKFFVGKLRERTSLAPSACTRGASHRERRPNSACRLARKRAS